MIIIKLQNGEYVRLNESEKNTLDKLGYLNTSLKQDVSKIVNKIMRKLIGGKALTVGVIYNGIRCDKELFDSAMETLLSSNRIAINDTFHQYNKKPVRLVSLVY